MIFIVQYTINNVLYIKWTQEYNTVHIIGRDSAKKNTIYNTNCLKYIMYTRIQYKIQIALFI